jgi:hypothetical protein
VRTWLDEVNKYSSDNPVIVILGNKVDLESNREVFENDVKVCKFKI